ncbi:CAP domain-containing protein [Maribacter sp. Asnod1-A12]|uniref:CAP domain-containing protein n=1 Tax=Maribacter sp. Asnod1-A12 TaxID=3160576 RepID=UPI003865C7C3
MKSTFIYFALILVFLTSCSRYENFAGYEDTSEDSLLQFTLASSKSHSTMEAELFRMINDHRLSLDLNELEFESTTYYYASLHTSYMISKGITSHDMFTKRAENISYRTDAIFVAENVARNYDTIEDAYNAWLDSTGHKKNIEGDFNYSAISIVENSNGDFYFTQIFVKQ